jgi:N-acetylmuramoyl-L-alanine amidase
MGIKICLDAGHFGKYNQSPVVPEYYESDMSWKLHLLLKEELEKYNGVEVIATRADKDKDMSLEARGEFSKGCDLFISIHSNGALRESADYPVVYYPVSGACADLAKALSKFVEETMDTVEAGEAVSRKSENGDWDYYSVIYGAVSVGVPGLIIEHSFHTNERSAKWLLDDNNLKKLAVGEAEVLAKHFGLVKAAEEEPEHWYRIRKSWEDAASQLGAYKNFESAKANCPDGYAVFDWHGNLVYERFGKYESEEYPQEEFVRDIQKACGAAVDGIPGAETLSKTVTLSQYINATHPAVKPLQQKLWVLGYQEVGAADGEAGPKFASAVAHYQQDNGCTPTGMMEEWGKTWQKMLGMA